MILSALKAAAAPYMMWIKLAGVVILIGLAIHQVRAYNERLREEGRAEIRAQNAAELARVKTAAEQETARLTKLAEDARNANANELTDLRVYRDSHPVTLWVPNRTGYCIPTAGPAPTFAINDGTGPGAGDIQPLPSRDTEQRNIGPLLDALTSRADQVSAQLREWQARQAGQ